MAFLDVLSFVVTATLFFGGIAGAIFLFQKIRGALSSTKASLQERGWTISKSGMSIKTNKRMDHSRYLDNTTRSGPNVMKAVSASTVGNTGITSTSPSASPNLSVQDSTKTLSRKSSSTSTHSATGSTDEKKRRKFFSHKASS